MKASGGTVDVTENIDELRKELTRFESDSKCFLDIVELLKKNPHLLSASDKLLVERELRHWSYLVSSFAITEGSTLRELCQSHHHTTTTNDTGTSSSDSLHPNLPPSTVSVYDGSATSPLSFNNQPDALTKPILPSALPPLLVLGKSTTAASTSVSAIIQTEPTSVVTSDLFESLFNQQPRAARRVVWQLEVLWPEWASQITKPGSTDTIGKWCYICRYCDVALSEQKQILLQNYDCSGDVLHSPSLVSASACEDVLSHFLSSEHWSSAFLLKKNLPFTRNGVVTGKFFQQSNAQLGMYCEFGGSRVYPPRVSLKIADVVIYPVNDSDIEKRSFKVVLRNDGSSYLLLRFEAAGVNPNLRHKISSYSFRDDNDAIIASLSNESVPAEYILAPRDERTFSASVILCGALKYNCSFGLFFLLIELDSVSGSEIDSGSVLAAGVLHAVPLVKVVDLGSKIFTRSASTSVSAIIQTETVVTSDFFESLFNQQPRATRRVVWQLKVFWPDWANQISKPGPADAIGKWCYICRHCDTSLAEQKKTLLEKNSWNPSDVVYTSSLVSSSVCKDLLNHYLSLEHWCSTFVLKKPLLSKVVGAPGKFFQQSTAQVHGSCTFGDGKALNFERKTNRFVIADVELRPKTKPARNWYFTVLYRNSGTCDLLLRFEAAGVNPNLRHKISSYFLKTGNDTIIASSNGLSNVPSEYVLAPGAKCYFNASVFLSDALEYSCSFGLCFLVAEFDFGSGKSAEVLRAEPLVTVIDLNDQVRKPKTNA